MIVMGETVLHLEIQVGSIADDGDGAVALHGEIISDNPQAGVANAGSGDRCKPPACRTP